MRKRHRDTTTLIARIVARAVVVAAALIVATPIGATRAHAATPTTLTGSLTLATPDTNLGPFVTTAPATVQFGNDHEVKVAQAGLAFTPITVVLDHSASFTVTLVPASDLVTMVDPSQSSAIMNGQFTMLWQQNDASSPPCSVGPFTVNASTAPFGSTPYSAQSNAVTMLDAAPSVPAAQDCSNASTVNGIVPLPVDPPPPAPPTNTVPNPAWTTTLTFSAPLPVTPPPTKPGPPSTVGAPTPPASTGATSPPPTAAATGGTHATARARAHSTKAAAKSTTRATATPPPINPNDVPDLLPIDPAPARAGYANGANNAIDPVPVGAKDPTSSTFVVGALAFLVIATALALRLIGHDIRGLLPARSRQRVGKLMATPPQLPRGANRSLNRKP
jgi:hypothetical protein